VEDGASVVAETHRFMQANTLDKRLKDLPKVA
jgi:hypothetical protein